jgi:hypothetical protein
VKPKLARVKPLSDEAERQRFIEEHGRNISVIAPAGVGKTYGIVQRILHGPALKFAARRFLPKSSAPFNRPSSAQSTASASSCSAASAITWACRRR